MNKLVSINIKFIILAITTLVIATTLDCQASFNLSSSTPANNATGTGQVVNFTLNFPVSVSHYTPNIYIKLASDNSTVQTIQWSDYAGQGTSTITFTSQTLSANTAYYLDGTNSAFYSGNPSNLSTAFRIDFNTGTPCYNFPSCLGPCFGGDIKVKYLSPPDNGHFMQSYEGIGIVFNGNVTVGTGNIYIKKFSDDSTIETIDVTSDRVTGWGTPNVNIDPVGNLSKDTQYYINFDIEGYSTSAEKTKWNFWTKSTPNTFSGSGL